jgi:uncharacterized NAD(P)/FAD-binding protein YdhS
MGVEVDDEGRVVNEGAADWLYALGPLRKGRLWETTAVPELRAQAQAIAAKLTAAAASGVT